MRKYITSYYQKICIKHPRTFIDSITLSTLTKYVIVMFLTRLLAWSPRLAMRLGKLVLEVWPAFRRV